MSHAVNDFAAALLAKAQELVAPLIGREGVVVGGSWQPTGELAGTAETVQGDTASVLGDDGDSPITHAHIPVATIAIGDQYGPRGGERSALIPTQSGWVKLFQHGPDDSPGAPAGERWICHRNAAGVIDAYVKLTNDGTAADGLGGISLLAGSLLEALTAMGAGMRFDDATKTAAFFSAGGLSITLDDNVQRAFIGKPGLTQNDAVMTQTDGQTLTNAIIAAVQTAINGLASLASPGSGIPANPLYTIAPVTAMGSSDIESQE